MQWLIPGISFNEDEMVETVNAKLQAEQLSAMKHEEVDAFAQRVARVMRKEQWIKYNGKSLPETITSKRMYETLRKNYPAWRELTRREDIALQALLEFFATLYRNGTQRGTLPKSRDWRSQFWREKPYGDR
jgi:hypothetical protein